MANRPSRRDKNPGPTRDSRGLAAPSTLMLAPGFGLVLRASRPDGCGVLRRHNLPIRDLTVASNGHPGTWKLSCVIEAEDAALKGLVLQINNVIGVRETTVTPSFLSEVS